MQDTQEFKPKGKLRDSLVRINKEDERSIYNTGSYDYSLKSIGRGHIKNYREEAVKNALLLSGANAYYEYMQYYINGKNSYFPDFITDIYFKGRQVILEPHGDFNKHYISKMKEFSKLYHNFYLVFIMSNNNYKHLDNYTINEIKRFSKIWIIKDFNDKKENLQESTMQILEKINELRMRDLDYKAYLRVKKDS